MKVRAKVSFAGPECDFSHGQVKEVDEKLGKSLLKDSLVEEVLEEVKPAAKKQKK